MRPRVRAARVACLEGPRDVARAAVPPARTDWLVADAVTVPSGAGSPEPIEMPTEGAAVTGQALEQW
jgi:hypothetical protein